MYAYSNNGLSFRAVGADYIAQTGEVIFPDVATPEELTASFSGYAAAGAELDAPPSVIISALQFFIGLSRAGFISSAEALASSRTGEVPSAIMAIFNTLPSSAAAESEMRWAKMTQVSEGEPLVHAFAAAQGMTTAQVHDFFVAAAAI